MQTTSRKLIAAFVGKNENFRIYLLAMKTWLAWETAGTAKKAVNQ